MPLPQPLSDPLAPPGREDLESTAFLELDDELVRRHLARAQAGGAGEHEVAARLFAAVRDGIRYDPYGVPTRPEAHRAGAVLRAGSGRDLPLRRILAALPGGLPGERRVGRAPLRQSEIRRPPFRFGAQVRKRRVPESFRPSASLTTIRTL